MRHHNSNIGDEADGDDDTIRARDIGRSRMISAWADEIGSLSTAVVRMEVAQEVREWINDHPCLSRIESLNHGLPVKPSSCVSSHLRTRGLA